MDSAERYSRQTMLPELGAEGQKRLSATKILLVGAGGLGSPIATYLTAAGIGTLGIIDADKVSVSNLQRQTLYTEDEVGQSKVECAYKRLHGLNHLRLFPDQGQCCGNHCRLRHGGGRLRQLRHTIHHQ